MREYDGEKESEVSATFIEILREEAILAELDPDRLGTEPPRGMPANEWAEFLAMCERAYPDE